EGLPSNPAVRFEQDLTPFGEQKLTAIAVNRNAQVLEACSDGASGFVFLIAPDADPRLVGNVGSVSSIRFSAAGDLAVFADRGWNQIILLQDLATTATPIQLATSVDGVADPVGIALLRDGRVAFVANAGAGTVTAAGLAGGAAQNFACNCGVNAMLPLTGD